MSSFGDLHLTFRLCRSDNFRTGDRFRRVGPGYRKSFVQHRAELFSQRNIKTTCPAVDLQNFGLVLGRRIGLAYADLLLRRSPLEADGREGNAQNEKEY